MCSLYVWEYGIMDTGVSHPLKIAGYFRFRKYTLHFRYQQKLLGVFWSLQTLTKEHWIGRWWWRKRKGNKSNLRSDGFPWDEFVYLPILMVNMPVTWIFWMFLVNGNFLWASLNIYSFTLPPIIIEVEVTAGTSMMSFLKTKGGGRVLPPLIRHLPHTVEELNWATKKKRL